MSRSGTESAVGEWFSEWCENCDRRVSGWYSDESARREQQRRIWCGECGTIVVCRPDGTEAKHD